MKVFEENIPGFSPYSVWTSVVAKPRNKENDWSFSKKNTNVYTFLPQMLILH